MSRLILLSLLATACKGVAVAPTDTDTGGPVGGELLGIGVAPRDPIARVGETVEFFATAYYENTTYENVTDEVTWTVANDRVAEIDSDGVVTALSEGSTEVIATDSSGKGNSVTLTVIDEGSTLDSVSISPASVSVNVGDEVQLSATATYSDGSTGTLGAACRWDSGDEAIASVDPVGRVTGEASGDTQVTATCSGIDSTASVTVVDAGVDIGDPDLVEVAAAVFANGTDVFWTLTVRNDGDATANGFFVDAYLEEPDAPGDGYIDTYLVSGLAPGEETGVSLEALGVAPGTYQTWVYVDPEDYVDEADESNNWAGPLSVEAVEPLLGPELTVAHFFAFTDGLTTEYLIEIENTGDVAAEDFFIDIFLDESVAPETCNDYGEDYTWVQSLAPGAHYTWDPTFGEAPASGTTWTSWVGVDLCGDVDEDDSDNVVSYVVEE